MKILLAFILSLFVQNSACASLIHQDVTEAKGLSFSVYDSETSLQWLSPTATVRLSLPDVFADSGGWLAMGFRYATSDDLKELMLHAGLTGGETSYPAQRLWSDKANVDKMIWLVTAMGWTYEHNAPSPGNDFGQRTVA